MSGFSYACQFTSCVWREADDAGRIRLVGFSDRRGNTTLFRRTKNCAETWPTCGCESCVRLAAWRKELGMEDVTP